MKPKVYLHLGREEDRYGSVLRESLKRSLQYPAQFKPTNRRESLVEVPLKAIIFFSLTLLIGGFYAWQLFNWIEGWFR